MARSARRSKKHQNIPDRPACPQCGGPVYLEPRTPIGALWVCQCRTCNGHIRAEAPGETKYHSVVCESDDGERFHSIRERNRYYELRLEAERGEITHLRRQVRFKFPGRIGSYVADFVYERAGAEVVEDAKGVRTPLYNKQRALMKHFHGIEILET